MDKKCLKDLYNDDAEHAGQAISDLFDAEQGYKKSWARIAKKCVAYTNGNQHSSIDVAPIMNDNQPVHTKNYFRNRMYQQNEIEPVVRTLISYMTRQRPTVNVSSVNNRDDKEENIARVGESVLRAKHDIDKEDTKTRQAAYWALTTGTVISKNFWDYSLGNYTNDIDYDGNQIVDPQTGRPLSNKKTGDNKSTILSGMSITCDHSITDFDEQPYLIESYFMDVDWARKAFDRDAPGYNPDAAKGISDSGKEGDVLNMLEDMKFDVPYMSGGDKSAKSKGKCLIQECYVMPNNDWRKGKLIIRAGDKVVFSSPKDSGSPYFMGFMPVMWHPYSAFIFEQYLGRLLGKGLVEQLLPLQTRLNEINGAILENANTLAKPNIMAVENQLKRGIMNGKGSNIYTYKFIPGASTPFAFAGIPLPQQFFEEKQSLIDAIVRIAGTNFVMQGQPPSGVSAASAISQLLENANSQQSDMMLAWEKFHEDRFTKKLRILHKFHKYPDLLLNSVMKDLASDCYKEQIKDFIGAKDLSDGIYVKIEKGSMIPKSDLATTGKYMESAEKGLLGPALQDPSPKGDNLRNQILKKLGLDPLVSPTNIEEEKAEWENDRIINEQMVEVSPYDKHEIHLETHITKIQNPTFLEDASDEVKIKLDDHIKAHQAEMDKKQMQEQQKKASMQKQEEEADAKEKLEKKKVKDDLEEEMILKEASKML